MTYFFIGGLLALACYLPLRYLKGLWEKELAPDGSTPVAGVLSWLLMGCVLLMGYGFLLTLLSISLTAAFIVTIVGLALYLNAISPEFLDLPHMVPFIRQCLVFENIAGKRLHLTEEMDKHEVRKVYKEITGNELKEEQKPSRPTYKRPEELQNELAQLQSRHTVTPHLQNELAVLQRWEEVDVTDSWTINSLRSSAHAFYKQVKRVRVVPSSRTITFDIDFGELNTTSLNKSEGVFRFYQELYEFLQAMNTQNWMEPYRKYYEQIVLTGLRTELDEFARTQTVLFLKLAIRAAELRSREQRFFNAAELPSISSVQFKSGQAVE